LCDATYGAGTTSTVIILETSRTANPDLYTFFSNSMTRDLRLQGPHRWPKLTSTLLLRVIRKRHAFPSSAFKKSWGPLALDRRI